MSEKAKRWRQYSFLGQIKAARTTLRELSKQPFVSKELLNRIDEADLSLSHLYRETEAAIRGVSK